MGESSSSAKMSIEVEQASGLALRLLKDMLGLAEPPLQPLFVSTDAHRKVKLTYTPFHLYIRPSVSSLIHSCLSSNTCELVYTQ